MKTVADLMQAIRAADESAVKTILETQPELANTTDANGNSPFLMGLYFGRSEIARILLSCGVRPNLFEASAAGMLDEVQRHIQQDAHSVHSRSHDGWTPLHLAAFFGHREVAARLLDAGAAMLAVSSNNEANLPINAAAAGRRNDVVRLFVERGCPPDARSSDGGYTALHLAANNGNLELIQFLLEAGGDRSLTTANGETALALAIKQGNSAAAEALRMN